MTRVHLFGLCFVSFWSRLRSRRLEVTKISDALVVTDGDNSSTASWEVGVPSDGQPDSERHAVPVCKETAENRHSVDVAVFRFDENRSWQVLAKPIAPHMRMAKLGKTHMNAGGKFYRDCPSLKDRSEDGQGSCERLHAIWGATLDESGVCQANNPYGVDTENTFQGEKLDRGEEAQLMFVMSRLTANRTKYIAPVDSGYASWLDLLSANRAPNGSASHHGFRSERVPLVWSGVTNMSSKIYTYYADNYTLSILQTKTPKYEMEWLNCSVALSDKFLLAPLLRQLYNLGKMPCPSYVPGYSAPINPRAIFEQQNAHSNWDQERMTAEFTEYMWQASEAQWYDENFPELALPAAKHRL